ncbi:hypothetical protein CIB95_07780 [Lottiidibacillus patelloidae]|uniref:Uncharacterized protein n=1 Tax=Lottiidibacillus patelloidae TaxID=2670334 RepID=A0A263BUY3_9BACI|nr:hypothetical protein [Lottiidibacillus patelloidae]OZM57352.1 hypothetical protein CIB95_07780 [Lottiidibacillus patelloidae]
MSITKIKLIPKEDMLHFQKIVIKAYPGWKLYFEEKLAKVKEKNHFIQENYHFSNFCLRG